MILTIHRGTNEIGGSCVEVKTETTRLLIDLGIPLVTSTGKEFDNSILKNKSISDLLKQKILPEIDGLYVDKSDINGILLSHAHLDHYGLLNFVNQDIPIYLGEATSKIIEINNIFLNQNVLFKYPNYFKKNVPFTIGDMTVTPYWNDHSAFDAYSFLIDSGGKSIFYSGDFRSNGRKRGAYRWLIHNPPNDIDYLILEGTSIKKNDSISEVDVEHKMAEIFNGIENGCFVWTSSQNIDRLVSVYKACIKEKKTLILDIYTANVLNILSEFAGLPSPIKGHNLKVLYTNRTTTKLYKSNREDLIFPFTKFKITSEELSQAPGQYIMLVRPSIMPEIKKIGWKSGTLVYSMWEGYKTKLYSAKFLDYFKQNGFDIIDIHASGHAGQETLQQFVNAINPKNIIPIHTFHKNDYQSVFSQNVIVLDDNQELKL